MDEEIIHVLMLKLSAILGRVSEVYRDPESKRSNTPKPRKIPRAPLSTFWFDRLQVKVVEPVKNSQ
jgi:hypothetical protein